MLMMSWWGEIVVVINFHIFNLCPRIPKGSIIYYTSKFCSVVHMEITMQFVKCYAKGMFIWGGLAWLTGLAHFAGTFSSPTSYDLFLARLAELEMFVMITWYSGAGNFHFKMAAHKFNFIPCCVMNIVTVFTILLTWLYIMWPYANYSWPPEKDKNVVNQPIFKAEKPAGVNIW